jgi:arginine/lysine/ornithine decarboxylase
VIKEAESLAAGLFNSKETIFVTAGTTVSNQIAIDALARPGMRILIDKNCHQSIHFDLKRRNAEIDYLDKIWSCTQSSKCLWSLENLLNLALTAQQDQRPYDLIVLNAHSYDGVIYDIPAVIKYLLGNGVITRTFLIDEAWGAANTFHNGLRPFAAMSAKWLLDDFPDLQVIATQSAHKALNCLRQASMIHYFGSDDLGVQLRLSRFRLHTTSPSYPILASIDLARAQMQMEGPYLLQRCQQLADRFRQEINGNVRLNGLSLNETEFLRHPICYAHVDPTKVSLNIEELGISASEAKEHLFSNYGIYVNRTTENSLLFNFHIGITEARLDIVLQALTEMSMLPRRWRNNDRSENFIIPYPPGVPIVVPGEPITASIRQQIRDIERSGAHVFYA